ncbi:MAG TPA: NAD-dependent epimerase/dehydratase family protein [Rhizomicrobium sp.]|nr:NAD-dependent epimerase/dehydratase family protein [Rhizomicrobium sp.]
MRALVIGGTGFIGKFVSRLLAAHGHDVSVFHRARHDLSTILPGATSIISTGPLSSSAALQTALAANPDIVVHMLAMRESEAEAAVQTFRGRIGRLAFASSGDVYRAYGRFTKFEPGPPDPVPLDPARSPLRSLLYPYRKSSTPRDALEYDYEKILVERVLLGDPLLPGVCLRLPKVYGRDNNADFATVHRFAHHPDWRWTHGYVENVAAAIVLAATHRDGGGRIYNVGEAHTPTVGERLRDLPASGMPALEGDAYDFGQDIVYDTTPIRNELGYGEPVSYEDAIRRTVG